MHCQYTLLDIQLLSLFSVPVPLATSLKGGWVEGGGRVAGYGSGAVLPHGCVNTNAQTCMSWHTLMCVFVCVFVHTASNIVAHISRNV